MIVRANKRALFYGQKTIVRGRQGAIQQSAQAKRMATADHADFACWRRPTVKQTAQQVRHAFPHGPTPEGMAVQILRHAAAAVRRAQRHDAPRFLPWMVMKQRADQNTAQAVPYEMHGIDIERVEEMREPFGIRAQIGADRRIGKWVNRETLAPQPAREHEHDVAREPQAVDKDDGFVFVQKARGKSKEKREKFLPGIFLTNFSLSS